MSPDPDRTAGPAPEFDEAAASFPPPGVGRYVRVYPASPPGSGEPDWRYAWAWDPGSGGGLVECGWTASGSGGVLMGRGPPPAACDWLPSEWPAGYFPLGATAEHLAGWRRFVLAALTEIPDTIPPDRREYGWRT